MVQALSTAVVLVLDLVPVLILVLVAPFVRPIVYSNLRKNPPFVNSNSRSTFSLTHRLSTSILLLYTLFSLRSTA